jgi:hypothetical protein
MPVLIKRLSEYAGEVSEFVGGKLGNDVVKSSEIRTRALEVAIPKGTMTSEQREIFDAVRSWAKTLPKPVDVIIIEF